MSQLSDAIANAQTAANNLAARTMTDLTAHRTTEAALQAQIAQLQAAGTVTPADLTALANLSTTLDGIDVTNPTTITDPTAAVPIPAAPTTGS